MSEQEQRSALADLKDTLASWGLEGLAPWAWEQIAQGVTSAEVVQSMRQQDAYKKRFAGMALRQKNGLVAISEAEYVANERAYTSIMRNAGLPSGFYDSPEDFTSWIGSDVAPQELQGRVKIAQETVGQNIASVKQAMKDFYGVSPDDGALLAYALDPTKGLDVINRQISAAQIAGAASDAGLSVDAGRAENLSALGVDQPAARGAYGQIGQILGAQSYQAGAQDQALTQAELENEAFLSDAEVARRRQRRARQAQGVFEGAGGVVATQQGLVGLGSIG